MTGAPSIAASFTSHRQTLAAALIVLAYLAERPLVFFRYPGLVEEAGWLKFVSLVLFIAAWWLLCLVLYLYAAKSRAVVKWSIFCLLAASTTFFDVYSAVSDDAAPLYEDYAILMDAVGSSRDALLRYYGHFVYPAMRLAVLFCGFALMRPEGKASAKAVSLFMSALVAFAGICVIKRGTHTNLLPGSTGLYGLSLASFFDSPGKDYRYSGTQLPSRPVDDVNIVLVVDESVRADFLMAGDLARVFRGHEGDWRYYDFGLATSAGNCSMASNIMLRMGVRPSSITEDLYSKPLIWSYALNAGFTTYLIDAQRGGRGHNHFDSFELELVSRNVDASRVKWDFELPGLMDHLARPGKTFTLVITRGSLFPYHRNFPSDHVLDSGSESRYVLSDPLRIAYAKSVDWQTKKFLRELIGLQVGKPTVVVYTSDHGQNLNDQAGPHQCTGSGTPFAGEGLVPLVVLTNYEEDRLAAATVFNHGKLSHFNIFPTLLSYMGFDVGETPTAESAYSLPIYSKVQALNRFSYGDAFGRFGESVKFVDVSESRNFALKRRVEGQRDGPTLPARTFLAARQ